MQLHCCVEGTLLVSGEGAGLDVGRHRHHVKAHHLRVLCVCCECVCVEGGGKGGGEKRATRLVQQVKRHIKAQHMYVPLHVQYVVEVNSS